MISRREFLAGSVALGLNARASAKSIAEYTPVIVNDIHSQLNPTRVIGVAEPRSVRELQGIIRFARKEKRSISVAGGRHAMGGQQFGADTLLIDIRKLNGITHFDRERGIVEVGAGIEWPQLIESYLTLQKGGQNSWGIAQKQTGADRLTIAGTVAANAHGRGLTMKPFIGDVESLVLVDGMGATHRCSRNENSELFRLVHGGYGLFGIVASVQIRLVPRTKVERVVEIRTVDDLASAFERRIADGFQYGDFQFAIARDSDDFLRKGVFSCYRQVPMETPMRSSQKELSDENWRQLLYLAHTDKKRAFEKYAKYYLSTNGQIYWSDTHQLSVYPDNYHLEIDQKTHAADPASEIITEINVPRSELGSFFDEVRNDFRANDVELIYGTVRIIEQDKESFLPWAKQAYACTVFNLHTVHSSEGLQRSAGTFRRLIDMAAKRGGSYHLTYHRFAERKQVTTCYPQFVEFLRLKKKYDTEESFQSDWYRHYNMMFADEL